MTTLEVLYLQDPFWIWFGVAALFVALSFATGVNLIFLPAACAAIVALAELAGVRLGIEAEAGLFCALTGLAFIGAFALQPRAKVALVGQAARPPRSNLGPGGAVDDEPTALVGRIARATGDFANGVGRVFIDGAEWAAELEGIEETLPRGASVRVIRVIGGVKLQVRSIGDQI